MGIPRCSILGIICEVHAGASLVADVNLTMEDLNVGFIRRRACRYVALNLAAWSKV